MAIFVGIHAAHFIPPEKRTWGQLYESAVIEKHLKFSWISPTQWAA